MASYPPSNDPNASTFNNQNYAGDNGMGLTYQQALKDFVAFPTTQSALITFPESINVGGQVECNSVLAQGVVPQISIKPTGVSAPPTLTYQAPVVDGVLTGLLSSSYIYTPEMTDADIGTTNPNVLITKSYADATYTAGTGTYATLDLDNTFTAVNTFTASSTATPVLIEGAGGANITLALLEQATDYSIFFLNNTGDGSYGSIVNAGDSAIVSTQGDINTGVLDLISHTSNVAGIKITSTGEQISGTITGYIERGGGAVIPLQFTSAQTSGNNPIADFVPILTTNTKLSVIADPTDAEFSHQTTIGDLVMCATTSTTGGSMELCSQGGASMRITPSSINMISSSTYNNFELLASLPLTAPQNRGLILSWNKSVGNGETDFLNCAEGGSGGFSFYNGSAVVAPYLIATISPTTISPTSNDTTLATTAFVQTAVSGISGYAPLNSPAFTGVPTAPTPSVSDNSTTIPTTAFVVSAIASALAPFVPISGQISIPYGFSSLSASGYITFAFGGTVGYFGPNFTGVGVLSFVSTLYNDGNEQQNFTLSVDIPTGGMVSGVNYSATYTMTADTYNWANGQKVGQPVSAYANYTLGVGCFLYIKWHTSQVSVSNMNGGFTGTTFTCDTFPNPYSGVFTYSAT